VWNVSNVKVKESGLGLVVYQKHVKEGKPAPTSLSDAALGWGEGVWSLVQMR